MKKIISLTILILAVFSACNSPATNDQSVNQSIVVDNVTEGQNISSPLEISGEAIGPWFFEAMFTIKLVDENNQVIALANAQAIGDWMTADLVPFTATLIFSTPSTPTGQIIFEKANPSGLAENADTYAIPINF